MVKRKSKTAKVKVSKREENCWFYGENCIEEPPLDCFGFIYRITNISDGRIYIGKKQFSFKKKIRLSKKARVGTRKRVEISRIDSGWKNYWSSSKSLKEDILKLGKDNFKREIIHYCKNKSELSYYEVHWQIKEEVLLNPSYNGWISCRIFKNKL